MQTRLPLYPFPDGFFKSFRVIEKDTEVLALKKRIEFLEKSRASYMGKLTEKNKIKV